MKQFFKSERTNILIILLIFIISIFVSVEMVFFEINNHNYYIKINSNEIEEKIAINEVTIIYFYKDNCSPCSKFKGLLNNYIESNNCTVFAVNINEDSENYFDLTDKYNIQYTPTVISFKKGKEKSRLSGLVNKKELEIFMKKQKIKTI